MQRVGALASSAGPVALCSIRGSAADQAAPFVPPGQSQISDFGSGPTRPAPIRPSQTHHHLPRLAFSSFPRSSQHFQLTPKLFAFRSLHPSLALRPRPHSPLTSASLSASTPALRSMSSLTLQEAIKPVRKGCAPVGANLKGKKKSKGDAELPDFVAPPPKNAMERREWVSGRASERRVRRSDLEDMERRADLEWLSGAAGPDEFEDGGVPFVLQAELQANLVSCL